MQAKSLVEWFNRPNLETLLGRFTYDVLNMLSRQMADLGQYGWRLPSSGGDLVSLLGGRGFCREASLPINHGLLADVFARDEDVLFSRLVEEILCFVVIIESTSSEERDVSCA